MLTERKAPYLRNVILRESVTRFGSKKLLAVKNPYVDCVKVNGRKIIRVDMLHGLQQIWGDTILESRHNIYLLVSGDCTDEKWINLMCAYYKTHSSFSRYMTMLDMMGSRSMTLPMKFVNDVRSMLNEYEKLVDIETSTFGKSKLLVSNEEYNWYSVPEHWDSSTLKGWCEVR